MQYTQAINLYLDTTGPLTPARFLVSRSSTATLPGRTLALVQGAALLVRLFLLKPAPGIGVDADCLTTDGAIIFGIKSNPAESTFLAVTSGFTFVADADLGDHYEAVLDLNTTGIQAELEAAASVEACTEIELQAPGNVRRAPYQSLATISRKIITGSEPDPSPASLVDAFIANSQAAVNAAVAEAEAAAAAVVDGKSAYEIAVDEGFVGDEAAWLASLVGAPGTNGTISGSNGVAQITASRDFSQADDGKWLYYTEGTGITLTMPATGITPGFGCTVIQSGSGQITFAAAGGVTLGNSFGYTKTRAQHSPASVGMLTATLGFTSGEMA